MRTDPTVTHADIERIIRSRLAGLLATTPYELFIFLDGAAANYNDEARVLMEWHLRTHGYVEQEVSPLCSTPRRLTWVRQTIWPEDRPWLDGDQNAILDQIEADLASGTWAGA